MNNYVIIHYDSSVWRSIDAPVHNCKALVKYDHLEIIERTEDYESLVKMIAVGGPDVIKYRRFHDVFFLEGYTDDFNLKIKYVGNTPVLDLDFIEYPDNHLPLIR